MSHLKFNNSVITFNLDNIIISTEGDQFLLLALEGFRETGILAKKYRDTGYYCKDLKGYGILGSILGICQILTKKTTDNNPKMTITIM